MSSSSSSSFGTWSPSQTPSLSRSTSSSPNVRYNQTHLTPHPRDLQGVSAATSSTIIADNSTAALSSRDLLPSSQTSSQQPSFPLRDNEEVAESSPSTRSRLLHLRHTHELRSSTLPFTPNTSSRFNGIPSRFRTSSSTMNCAVNSRYFSRSKATDTITNTHSTSYYFGAPGIDEEKNETPENSPLLSDDDDDDENAVEDLLRPFELLPASLVDDVSTSEDISSRLRPPVSLRAAATEFSQPPSSTISSSSLLRSNANDNVAPSYMSVVPIDEDEQQHLKQSIHIMQAQQLPLPVVTKICPFFLQGTCRYGTYCRFLHQFGSDCPLCGMPVPLDVVAQKEHMQMCHEVLAIEEERRVSATIQCGICFELIVRGGGKFGLLQGCSHAFCLPCIRTWRSTQGQHKETLRACPLCRQDSHFVVPSDRMVYDAERKSILIEQYISRLNQIECKWFNRGRGQCPFGTSCMYAHYLEDGRVAVPDPLAFGASNVDGEVEICRPVSLADYFNE